MCCAVNNTVFDAMGTIFDIKEFTVHDGPGARVTVFFKGCPLRCLWCHNPEGLLVKPQVMYRSTLCAHCDACRLPCDHPECAELDRCIHACPNGCLSVAGENLSAEGLADRLKGYAPMLHAMGGGITFSGGEPLLQADFLLEVTSRLPGLHLAIQTSGYAEADVYRKVIDKMDYVMQDIKLADPVRHKQYTGVSNECILENVRWLKDSGKEFVFRVPLIPNITDTDENLHAIAEIVEESPVELMSYNTMAGAKYPMVDMKYSLTADRNREEEITRYFSNATLLK